MSRNSFRTLYDALAAEARLKKREGMRASAGSAPPSAVVGVDGAYVGTLAGRGEGGSSKAVPAKAGKSRAGTGHTGKGNVGKGNVGRGSAQQRAPQHKGHHAAHGSYGAEAPGEVRIIGGQWKRTRLAVPQHPGLRPTPERVRGTLFNWLGQDLTGWRCLDAFAGTGALGFEAASRGARQVRLVEQDAGLALQLERITRQLGAQATIQIQRGEAVAVLHNSAPGHWDAIFLDPPFAAPHLFIPALQAAAQAVAPHGYIYLEAPTAWSQADLAPLGLVLHRHTRAGAVHAHLLRLHTSADDGAGQDYSQRPQHL